MTQHISATLDPKLLANADRYYTANLGQMIDEIAQNARRAGADAIAFTLDGTTLHVSDNGPGLSSDKAAILLRLGGSANSDEVETRENAAGMGFFSMARYGVIVRSQDWELTAPPETFTGKTSATLEDGLDSIEGMRIAIPNINEASDWRTFRQGHLVRDALKYSGLRVTTAGFEQGNGIHEPQNFLDRPRHREPGTEAVVRSKYGVTIKVALLQGTGPLAQLNFFGKVIDFKGITSDTTLDRFARFDTDGRIVSTEQKFDVLIDVETTSHIKMQLPERNKIVENRGLSLVHAEIIDMIQEILIRPEVRNGIRFDSPLREGRGAAIAPPQIALARALMTSEDYGDPIGISDQGRILMEDKTIVDPKDVISADPSDFFVSIIDTERSAESLNAHPMIDLSDMKHAFGVENITTIDSMMLIVKSDGEEYNITLPHIATDFSSLHYNIDQDGNLPSLKEGFVDDLALRMTIIHGEITKDVMLPIAHFFYSDNGDHTDANVFLLKGDQGDVVGAMMRGTGWYNDDKDYDPQEEEASDLFHAQIARLTGTTHVAILGDISTEIQNILSRHLGYISNSEHHFDLQIQIVHGKNGPIIAAAMLKENENTLASLEKPLAA